MALSGLVSFIANASDDVGVAGLRFSVDGEDAGLEAMAAPYEWSWDSSHAANGIHIVAAIARDAAGHETAGSLVLTVANDWRSL